MTSAASDSLHDLLCRYVFPVRGWIQDGLEYGSRSSGNHQDLSFKGVVKVFCFARESSTDTATRGYILCSMIVLARLI